ncbi:MAG TPA: 1,4-beta-xylanase, partial [Verrucomicrobiota bacterium]|nr:1,4-beta-xylanase [Verrucomicrobiota bacterium]
MKTKYIELCVSIVICWCTAIATAQPALKEVFKNDFLIGAALNPWQVSGASTGEVQIIKKHFNTVTSE